MLAKLSVDQALMKARSHAKKGEVLESQKLYQAVLLAFPKNKRAQEGLAALNKPKQNPPQEAVNQLVNLYNQGQLSAVVEQAQTLTEQYPNTFIVWNFLGAAHNGLGRVEQASEAFKKVTELNPNYADGFNNLGATLKDQGKLEEAVEAYKKALSLKPNYTEAYNNMGNALKNLGKLDEAIEAYNKSISLKPNYADCYYNMGVALKDQGKLDKALEAYNKALSLKPDHPETYNNIGNALKDQGKLDEALEAYNKACSLKSNYAGAYYNCSIVYNLKGNLQKGLELYEWRLKMKEFESKIPRKNLIWDGSKSLKRKKFLVYEEQGLGDIIQFCRYLPLLKQKGAQVTFKVKQKMHALLHTIDGDIVLVDSYPDDNKIDFEAPLMSLPFLFNTNLDTIPSRIPYLFADHDKAASWGKRLTKATFKVGICWQGSKNKIDFGRSFPLSLFIGISQLPNVELISLHKGEGEKQIKDINFEMTTLGDDFDAGEDAFIDTAAVMANCDLIITSDTAIAHLAGALGCPTWLALKKIPEWYWMLDRNDSPLYPNMTLYRQKQRGNWKYVFDTMQRDLRSLLKQEKSIK